MELVIYAAFLTLSLVAYALRQVSHNRPIFVYYMNMCIKKMFLLLNMYKIYCISFKCDHYCTIPQVANKGEEKKVSVSNINFKR